MDAIGGFLNIELRYKERYHAEANIALNTARNCFKYLLNSQNFGHIYMPYFTCEVIFEPLRKLGIDFTFYSVDRNLEPIFDFSTLSSNDAFLYTNYFGIKDNYIKVLTQKRINLIIDNSQSFFSKAINGVHTFYSARKFIGVADGAYLYTDKILNVELDYDQSFNRMEHLLKRIDLSAEESYLLFLENDSSLNDQPIKRMSRLTDRMLASVDYEFIKQRRIENFNYLHQQLSGLNRMNIDKPENQVPLTYPFWSRDLSLRKTLQEKRVYCATYWPNVLNKLINIDDVEYQLTNEIVHLPIDQRLEIADIKQIINYITNSNSQV